jgi:hypothetical protein
MLKLMSSLLRRLGSDSADRRRPASARRQLPVTISLLDPKTRALVRGPASTMQGQLRDINKKGLSFVMPSINCSDPFFICSGHLLLVTLKFQNRDVGIQAYPVRYDIDEGRGEYKYLIGARIVQINRSDRKYIEQYIKSGEAGASVVHSIARYLYSSLVNRIHVRRSGMQIPLNVSITETKLHGRPTATTTPGYLNDISKTGLSLVIPSIRFGDRYPVGDNYSLRIAIQLPHKLINIAAIPIRYNRLGESPNEHRYLIGARITRMDGLDRKHLTRHIKQMKKQKTVVAQTKFAHDVEPL